MIGTTWTAFPCFLYFLPLVLLLTVAVPKRWKPAVLTAAGLVACAFGGWQKLLLSLVGVLGNWLVLRLLPKEGTGNRSVLFWVGMALALLLPAVVAPLLGCWSLLLTLQAMQAMECLVERQRGTFALPSLLQYASYQYALTRMMGGPLLRWSDVETIRREQTMRLEAVGKSVGTVIFGFAKLVLIALPMADIWRQISAQTAAQTLSALDAWFGLLACLFAVTFGLSGAAELGQGLAGMLGYAYPDSFACPVCAQTLRQYWSRYYRSVWQWMHRVFAIPERPDDRPTHGLQLLLANACVWLCFGRGIPGLLVGGITGLLLVLSDRFHARLQHTLPPIVRGLCVNLLVLLGIGIAAQSSIPNLLSYLGALFGANGFAMQQAFRYCLQTQWVYFLLGLLALFPLRERLRAAWSRRKGLQAVGVIGIPLAQLTVLLLCLATLLERAAER